MFFAKQPEVGCVIVDVIYVNTPLLTSEDKAFESFRANF